MLGGIGEEAMAWLNGDTNKLKIDNIIWQTAVAWINRKSNLSNAQFVRSEVDKGDTHLNDSSFQLTDWKENRQSSRFSVPLDLAVTNDLTSACLSFLVFHFFLNARRRPAFQSSFTIIESVRCNEKPAG
jgi:hypothetical protein